MTSSVTQDIGRLEEEFKGPITRVWMGRGGIRGGEGEEGAKVVEVGGGGKTSGGGKM